MSLATQQFAAKLAPHVISACLNSGVFPSVVIGQAVQEGGVGANKSDLAFKYNNPFGHKAFASWKGEKVRLNGSNWRVYPSLEDAVKTHISILKQPNYKIYGVLRATTPLKQLQAIQKGGYNVGPDKHKYANLIYSGIIKPNNIEQYDRKLMALERTKNENNLAYSEQDGIVRALHNLFA